MHGCPLVTKGLLFSRNLLLVQSSSLLQLAPSNNKQDALSVILDEQIPV